MLPFLARRSSILLLALAATGCGSDEPGTVRGSDVDVLLACNADSVCPSLALESSNGQPLDSTPAADCLLPSLRDRLPGRYVVSRTGGDAASSSYSVHVLVVAADGSVKHAYKLSSYDGSSATTDADSEVCQLVPAATLDACIATVKGGDPVQAEGCLPKSDQGALPWLEGCTLTPPSCE